MFDRPIEPNLDINMAINDHADYFAAGARADQLRWCEEAVFAQAFDQVRWTVPATREHSWYIHQALDAAAVDQSSQQPLGLISKQGASDITVGQARHNNAIIPAIRLGTHYAYRTGHSTFEWNGRLYELTDYKGRHILAPDDQMWGWFQQRKILLFKINANQADEDYDRVVFGTKDDQYTAFVEKYGFKGRRAIAGTRTQDYEERLAARNPHRGKLGGKYLVGVSDAQKQNRWDEINEESGLRVKHAPCILMKNRYILNQDSFVTMYLSGSKGTGANSGSRARPDHVTDHEIYRMFSGKDRDRILSNTLFGRRDLQIVKVGKKKNNWWNKNQITRWWRIRNQN
jgi:hypothetical protein